MTEPSVNPFPVLTLREPIFHGVDLIGCASANMTMDVLSRFLDKHRTCARSTTLVADRNNGKIIAFEATTKGVRAARAERLNRLRCPAFLLSGLLTCGCCGGKYGVDDRYGCLGHFRKGMCDNGRTIRRDDIERRVLAGLTDKLVSLEAVAVAVRAYAVETNRQNHERRAQLEADRRALEKMRGVSKGS